MGKASELVDRLSSQPLTPLEVKARKAAAEISDDDIVVTSDGKLEKPTPSGVPRMVQQVPAPKWD
jgi:hypothetical protein